jgi:hypothetical protein
MPRRPFEGGYMIDAKTIDIDEINAVVRRQLKKQGYDPSYREIALRNGQLISQQEAAQRAGVSVEAVKHLLRSGVSLDSVPDGDEVLVTAWGIEQLKVIAKEAG